VGSFYHAGHHVAQYRTAPARRRDDAAGAGRCQRRLLADHFLARYVALEVVALCVSLAPLAEIKSLAATHLAWRTYLLLRAGDAGMLAAVILLHDASRTLQIEPALEAGTALGGTQLDWIAAGFALAAWVKLGGWPFHLWRRSLPVLTYGRSGCILESSLHAAMKSAWQCTDFQAVTGAVGLPTGRGVDAENPPTVTARSTVGAGVFFGG
jgi:hypothetical protein